MSTEKKTTKKNEKKILADIPEEKPIREESHSPVVKNSSQKKTWKFSDSTLIDVQSNVFGELIYIDSRTGDKVVWSEFGDIQTMTMANLRSMRNTQRAFFENNWIFVYSIDDDEYAEAEPEDVYKALLVSQYYKNSLDPDNFYDIFKCADDELEGVIGRMSSSGKTNLIVAANEAIKNGALDSLKKIRMLEDLLDCELVEIE